jgi:PAS domain S-box-containing protein
MNITSHLEAQNKTPGLWSRLAWLPIPLLLASIIAARMAGLNDSYEFNTLRLLLSVTFYTLVSLGTLYLIGRSFLASGSPGLLLLECGVLLWSLAGTVGDFVSHGDANIDVTVFNTGILLSGMCHLSGAILALRPQQALRAKPVWLAVGCALTLGALWLVAKATVSGWLPVFFIPGHGGTPVRYCVLISAISMFVLSASVLKMSQRTAHLPFTSWYILALLLLAVGLFGVMIQVSLGSVVNWLSHTAQWLGGLYLLFAAIASLRESQLPLFPQENKSHPAYYREAFAVAVVLAASAIRLAFLSMLGMRAPFVTFYPAVIFAALYGGLRAGLLATALSAILVDYLWIAPVGQLNIEQPSDWLALMIFLLSGAMISGVSDAMHRARARAFAAETQALLAAEREAASEALRKNESRLRLAQESANVGIWDWIVETGELNFTPELNKLYGLPSGTIKTYQDWRDRVHPDDIGRIEAGRDEAIAKHEPFDLEFRGRHSSGEYRWISTKGGATFKEAGKAIRVFGVNIDITERKRAEEALKESELRFRTMANAMPQLAWIARADGHIFWYNQRWYEYTGTVPEQMEGWGWQSVHDPTELPKVLERWQTSIATGEPFDMTFPLRGADGVFRPFLTRVIPLKDGAGRVLQWFGTNTDVSELKRIEQALRESEALYRSIGESIDYGVWVCTADGRNTYASESFLKMVGITQEQCSNFSWGDVLHPDDAERTIAAWQECVRTGGKWDIEHRFRGTDGQWHHVLARGVPVSNEQGEIISWAGINLDISRLKQAEEALKELNEELENLVAQRTAELREKDQILLLQSRLAAMGEMIGNIAHQWRQPLNALGLIIQQTVLFYDLGELDKEVLNKNASQSMELIKHMSRTIDDFRNYFKPDKEKVEFNVRESIAKTVSLIEDSFKNQNISIEVVVNDDPVIYGYPNELSQALLNIINNARDALIERKIGNPLLTITIGSEDGRAFITIADNAGGIPGEIKDRIFDPYFTTKGPQQGTGVGLFMSKSIIEKNMGGRLTVRNIANGAEFRIEV